MKTQTEKTMVIETRNLEELALDWMAGKAHGLNLELAYVADQSTGAPKIAFVCSVAPNDQNGITKSQWNPANNWFDAGVLVDAHIKRLGDCGEPIAGWDAIPEGKQRFAMTHDNEFATGETLCMAVCRAVVLAKLGTSVEVPAVLVKS